MTFGIICPYCEERVEILVVAPTAATGEQILTIYNPYVGTTADPRRN